MSATTLRPDYRAKIVPALHRIQHEFGYLKREALEEAALELGVPLNRLQGVAAFFPHFRLSPPKKFTINVCRDMACHMAGTNETIAKLKASLADQVEVHGVSCLGRCDRAPAACISTVGHHQDDYYLGRSTDELRQIVESHLSGEVPAPDLDINRGYKPSDFDINPYGVDAPEYGALLKVISIRNSALDAAAHVLQKKGWSPVKIEQFRSAAMERRHRSEIPDKEVADAVHAFATDSGWAREHTHTGEVMPPPPPKPAEGERPARDTRPPSIGAWSELVLNEFKDADLRGMGGAGIPSIQKLRDVRDAIRGRLNRDDNRGFIVVNGDESEPGTFKDREILLHVPHVVVEGVIIAGLITSATQGFIYIRHEYMEQIAACDRAIARARELGLCGKNASALGRSFVVETFTSPGGYICGEQSALIEAMSDRRGEPRNLPPKLETNGLEDLPTIVSNVETYGWMPYISLKGGRPYAKLGQNTWKGRRLFSISGDLKRPGVYEVPMGMTLRELIYDEKYCGGILGDKKLKAFAPSGPSGGFLPARLKVRKTDSEDWIAFATRRGLDPTVGEFDTVDLELELALFRALSPTSALGAGLVVYSEDRDMVDQAVNAMEFYRNESCGKCVPCRIGSQKMASLGSHLIAGDIPTDRWNNELMPLMKDMSGAIEAASICGLGRSVPVPLRTVTNYFPRDVERHLAPAVNPIPQATT